MMLPVCIMTTQDLVYLLGLIRGRRKPWCLS